VRLSTQLTSSYKRRFLVVVCGMLLVGALALSAVFVYYSYSGLPEDLFFHRTDRLFCVKCGSQSLSYTTMILDGVGRHSTDPRVIQWPKIDGIVPNRCKHEFQIIAAQDQYIDFRSLQFKRSRFGRLEGDPLWSKTTVIVAFANLSRTNIQDSFEIFAYLTALQIKGRVSGKLLEAVNGTNANQVVPVLYQLYTNQGNVLASQKKSKR
jgi:hypothetical protein